MTYPPLISVIVPCYNQAEYMDECLQSVLEQTYQNWECIIVNDGSLDNTEEIALQWSAKDPRFKYLKKENGGLSSARNAGIEIAQGEWILPLDSDDKIGDRYLELCYEEIKKGYNLIYTKLQLFGTTEKVLDVPTNYEDILYFNPFYCSCIFEKSKWNKVGGYDENLKDGLEDWEFWINIIKNTDIKISKIENYVGFFYRRKEESMNTIMNSSAEKFNNAMDFIISKHSAHYAKDFSRIQNYIGESKRLWHSIEVLKKSRIIKIANKLGFLQWIQKI